MLIRVEVQIAFELGNTGSRNAIRRGELGHDQPASGLAPAEQVIVGGLQVYVADEPAEHGVRNASHWRQDCCRRDAYIADLERLRHLRLRRAFALERWL